MFVFRHGLAHSTASLFEKIEVWFLPCIFCGMLRILPALDLDMPSIWRPSVAIFEGGLLKESGCTLNKLLQRLSVSSLRDVGRGIGEGQGREISPEA